MVARIAIRLRRIDGSGDGGDVTPATTTTTIMLTILMAAATAFALSAALVGAAETPRIADDAAVIANTTPTYTTGELVPLLQANDDDYDYDVEEDWRPQRRVKRNAEKAARASGDSTSATLVGGGSKRSSSTSSSDTAVSGSSSSSNTTKAANETAKKQAKKDPWWKRAGKWVKHKAKRLKHKAKWLLSSKYRKEYARKQKAEKEAKANGGAKDNDTTATSGESHSSTTKKTSLSSNSVRNRHLVSTKMNNSAGGAIITNETTTMSAAERESCATFVRTLTECLKKAKKAGVVGKRSADAPPTANGALEPLQTLVADAEKRAHIAHIERYAASVDDTTVKKQPQRTALKELLFADGEGDDDESALVWALGELRVRPSEWGVVDAAKNNGGEEDQHQQQQHHQQQQQHVVNSIRAFVERLKEALTKNYQNEREQKLSESHRKLLQHMRAVVSAPPPSPQQSQHSDTNTNPNKDHHKTTTSSLLAFILEQRAALTHFGFGAGVAKTRASAKKADREAAVEDADYERKETIRLLHADADAHANGAGDDAPPSLDATLAQAAQKLSALANADAATLAGTLSTLRRAAKRHPALRGVDRRLIALLKRVESAAANNNRNGGSEAAATALVEFLVGGGGEHAQNSSHSPHSNDNHHHHNDDEHHPPQGLEALADFERRISAPAADDAAHCAAKTKTLELLRATSGAVHDALETAKSRVVTPHHRNQHHHNGGYNNYDDDDNSFERRQQQQLPAFFRYVERVRLDSQVLTAIREVCEAQRKQSGELNTKKKALKRIVYEHRVELSDGFATRILAAELAEVKAAIRDANANKNHSYLDSVHDAFEKAKAKLNGDDDDDYNDYGSNRRRNYGQQQQQHSAAEMAFFEFVALARVDGRLLALLGDLNGARDGNTSQGLQLKLNKLIIGDDDDDNNYGRNNGNRRRGYHNDDDDSRSMQSVKRRRRQRLDELADFEQRLSVEESAKMAEWIGNANAKAYNALVGAKRAVNEAEASANVENPQDLWGNDDDDEEEERNGGDDTAPNMAFFAFVERTHTYPPAKSDSSNVLRKMGSLFGL